MDQVRCDCGALVRADGPAQRLAALIDHARSVHGTLLSAEYAEIVLRRGVGSNDVWSVHDRVVVR